MMLRRLIYPRYSYTEKITFVSKLTQAVYKRKCDMKLVYKGECDMKLVEVRESKRRQGEKKKMQMQLTRLFFGSLAIFVQRPACIRNSMVCDVVLTICFMTQHRYIEGKEFPLLEQIIRNQTKQVRETSHDLLTSAAYTYPWAKSRLWLDRSERALLWRVITALLLNHFWPPHTREWCFGL